MGEGVIVEVGPLQDGIKRCRCAIVTDMGLMEDMNEGIEDLLGRGLLKGGVLSLCGGGL